LNTGLRATIACFRRQLEENRCAAPGREALRMDATIRFPPRTVLPAEDRRAASLHEAAPKLPQSLA
jgi:hypothetical protein